jgi:hypothetical protein
VLELRKIWLGEDHHLVAKPINNLAFVCSCHGRYRKAKALLVEALLLELYKFASGRES